MDDPIFTELRKLVGQHEKIVYEAVKAEQCPNSRMRASS